MNLAGYVVRVQLSSAGQQELGAVLQTGQEIEAFVVSQSSVGLWIWVSNRSTVPAVMTIMLLKWEHFSTVSFEYRPESPVERTRVGFQS